MTTTDTPTHDNLTFGERLEIWRRRRGWTQRDVAREALLPRRTVQELEKDIYRGELRADVEARVDLGGVLHDHERCVVVRRRAAMSVNALAALWGKSRQWIHEVETGNACPNALLAFWGI